MSEERYVKQIVSDVMEMAAKIKFLEAKVAASESWNAECVADHDAALRRAKAEGRQEGKEYALNEAAMRAGCAAHRACCGIEADNSQGKIHGYCVVCGVPWPCETAQFFLFKADARAAQIEEGE